MSPFSTMLHGGGIKLHGDLDPLQFEPGAGLTHDQNQSDCISIIAVFERELFGGLAGPRR
jgi:hypothetical protein